MASLWAKAMSAAGEAVKSVNSVAASLSLDNLQSQFGEEGKSGGGGAGGTSGSSGASSRSALLRSLDVTYLSPRLIAMGFPSTPATRTRSRNDAAAVASALKALHGAGHVMVWNLAEEVYDYALFDNQVRIGGCMWRCCGWIGVFAAAIAQSRAQPPSYAPPP